MGLTQPVSSLFRMRVSRNASVGVQSPEYLKETEKVAFSRFLPMNFNLYMIMRVTVVWNFCVIFG